MLNQEEIDQQKKLLDTYRRNLQHLLQQAARHGSEKLAPVSVMNEIHEARENIKAIKKELRLEGVKVEDKSIDRPSVNIGWHLPAIMAKL